MRRDVRRQRHAVHVAGYPVHGRLPGLGVDLEENHRVRQRVGPTRRGIHPHQQEIQHVVAVPVGGVWGLLTRWHVRCRQGCHRADRRRWLIGAGGHRDEALTRRRRRRIARVSNYLPAAVGRGNLSGIPPPARDRAVQTGGGALKVADFDGKDSMNEEWPSREYYDGQHAGPLQRARGGGSPSTSLLLGKDPGGHEVSVRHRPEVVDQRHHVEDHEAAQPRLVRGVVQQSVAGEQNQAHQDDSNGDRRDGHDRPSAPVAGRDLAEPREHERQRGRREGLLE